SVGATLYGDGGSDKIYGGPGNDTIYGGDDADEIDGGAGNDTIDAGSGNDVIRWTIANGTHNTVTAGGGNDVFVVTASANADVIQVSKSGVNLLVQRLSGTQPTATVTSQIVGSGFEELILDAGAGADTITIHDLTGSTTTRVTVDTGKVRTTDPTATTPQTTTSGVVVNVPV